MTKQIRQIRIEGNIAYVPLTRGYEAIVDAADVPLVSGFNWHAYVSGRSIYVRRTDRSGPKQVTIMMHRVLMGDPDGLEVDHKDSNGLNNRRSNLRKATKHQNMQNLRTPRTNSSGFKGVDWHKSNGKWRSRIRANGKFKHLGHFATPEEAHAAYCAASRELHGEFSRVK